VKCNYVTVTILTCRHSPN